jgi:hypothetical protein
MGVGEESPRPSPRVAAIKLLRRVDKDGVVRSVALRGVPHKGVSGSVRKKLQSTKALPPARSTYHQICIANMVLNYAAADDNHAWEGKSDSCCSHRDGATELELRNHCVCHSDTCVLTCMACTQYRVNQGAKVRGNVLQQTGAWIVRGYRKTVCSLTTTDWRSPARDRDSYSCGRTSYRQSSRQ